MQGFGDLAMARFTTIAMMAGLAAVAAAPATATPTAAHIYALNGSLSDSNGGPSLALVGTPTLGATGVTFAYGQGLSLAIGAFDDSQTYSVAIDFSFDSVGRYNRVLNTSGNDNGLYIHSGDGLPAPAVNYYHGGPQDGAAFATGVLHQLLFTRDISGISIYLDGINALNTAAFGSSALGSNPARFFIDDGSEMTSGYVDSICTFNGKLGASDAAALAGGSCAVTASQGAVPEPASWALLAGGFGLVGGALRRRKIVFA